MCKPQFVGVVLVIVLAFSPSVEAKPCKWVGAGGEIHYGEVASPAQGGAGQTDKTDAVDNCTEILSPEAARARDQEAAKKEQEKKRRANALRNTYSSEKEIDLAFERNSALISARLEAYNVQLKSAQDTLDDLKKYMDGRKREGKAIPQSAYDDMAETEARVARLQSERAKVEEELQAMKARCEEDKMLYRKISVMPPANDAQPEIDTSYPDANDYRTCCTKSKRARKSRPTSQY